MPTDETAALARSSCKCSVCTKMSLRTPHYMNTAFDDGLGLFDNLDLGLFEVYDMTSNDTRRISHRAATRTADHAQRLLGRLQNELADLGIIRDAHQKFTGTLDRARVMAPFNKHEVVLGPRLGSGGFSCVYEVAGFALESDVSEDCDAAELAARNFLVRHAHRLPPTCEKTIDKKDPMDGVKRKPGLPPRTSARYAVKHLRPSLVDDEDKFEKAAVDLALEGQLLMVLDHPNIVSIRGWAKHGCDSFRGGSPSDYFLILDCLPETLDDRIFAWRQAFRKYKSREGLPWRRRKFGLKLHNILCERLGVAADIAYAIQYMHDRRIINRDLKTSNIGFDAHGQVRIFDLGLARLLPRKDKARHDGYVMSRVGTRSTMAPEVRHKEPYNLSADVYSFGVVLWELLALCTAGEYFRKVRRERRKAGESDEHHRCDDEEVCPLPICECWPPAMQELVRTCLSYHAEDRPTMTEVRGTLMSQLESLGVEQHQEPKRRRSTFRLDLTRSDAHTIAAESKGSLSTVAMDIASVSDHPDSES